jgi:hypothetical protein
MKTVRAEHKIELFLASIGEFDFNVFRLLNKTFDTGREGNWNVASRIEKRRVECGTMDCDGGPEF